MLPNFFLVATAVIGTVNAATYSASFTEYGSSDDNGSGTCNTNTAACGFYTNPGYSAAVSQNLYGVGPGAGAGPACGACYKLTAETDSSGNKLSNAGNSIVVMVNNLCPADGNTLCSQSSTSSTNQYGANVNFDLCMDDGASDALFGDSGVGLAVGSATEVDCSQWEGTKQT
ncbi:glycoside hydrolase family 45 protein [Saccharata proteae CBS 121410]|uniref:Glycoside hydrolase family 45 protein n=1 Tax=Saccharata proteae CBS 121410 TaxID=1314787 RepID=A0A9P4HRG5_9PEZI|nr:glycoside hydrolase family 45 protein [Saccharata proteae CBS 121410]